MDFTNCFITHSLFYLFDELSYNKGRFDASDLPERIRAIALENKKNHREDTGEEELRAGPLPEEFYRGLRGKEHGWPRISAYREKDDEIKRWLRWAERLFGVLRIEVVGGDKVCNRNTLDKLQQKTQKKIRGSP